jgi:aspartate aminotransferase
MKINLSDKVERVKPSPTIAVAARASELQAAGEDIMDLSVGEPDFDTPEHIKKAAVEAIKAGFTKYTAVDGTPGLKKAIIQKFARENQLNYEANQILVSAGAKQSIYNLFIALLNPGDEVIIPAPFWVSYPDMVLLADGVPVKLATTHLNHFKITANQLEAAITPKTRLLVLNSPSNPTGIAYTPAELTHIAEVLQAHPNIVIMTDDIYEHILWSEIPFANIVNVCPELYDRTIVVNGVSKAYAMTGWRIGYAAGPAAVISAMKKVQSQCTSAPNSIAQVAAQVALESDQSFIKTMVAAYKERHDVIVAGLNEIEGVECLRADGTFYAFPYIQKAMTKLELKNDIEFADYLLSKAKVAGVPGSAFGAPGYIRFSYATSLKTIKEALKRIKAALE